MIGPNCRHKHVRKMVCQNYLTGFCPDGLNCPNGHPKYELPVMHGNEGGALGDDRQQQPPPQQLQQSSHHHQQQQQQQQQKQKQNDSDDMPQRATHINRPQSGFYRRLEDVQCYKCGQQGHYANRCPQGRGGGGGGGNNSRQSQHNNN